MEDYYIKYAKALEELSIEELRSKISEWQNWTKEELELIIFISNGVKNESMNSTINIYINLNRTESII